jgi:hypothetical protein
MPANFQLGDLARPGSTTSCVSGTVPVSLDDAQVHEIRAVLDQELVLGREDFKDRIAAMTQRRVRRGKDGRPSKTGV